MIFGKLLNGVSSRLSPYAPPSGKSESEAIINDILSTASEDSPSAIVSEISGLSHEAGIAMDIEQYAASFLEYAPVTVFISDFSGVFLYGNAMAEKMTGYHRYELIGRSFLNVSLIHSDSLPKVAQLLVLSRLGRSTGPDEIKLVKKEGSSIWVELRTTPFKLDGRQVTLGFVQDISDRKTAEEVLRREKEKASSYFDIADVILLVVDADARVTGINRKGCALLGYDKDELIGKNWFKTCLPVEFREEMSDVHRKLMAGEVEAVEYHENPVVTKNGQIKTIAWHNSVVKDDAGNIVGALCSGEDITERKYLEEQLFRLSTAISFSNDCIVITDASAMIIDVNRKAQEMYGAQHKEDMLGKHILELIVQEDRSKVNFDVFEIMEKGYQDSQVYNMISLNGASYPVRMSTSLIMSSDNTPMGMVRIYNRVR
jgi:PAS domain S-box-containing protein